MTQSDKKQLISRLEKAARIGFAVLLAIGLAQAALTLVG